jgi:hypothetical protein
MSDELGEDRTNECCTCLISDKNVLELACSHRIHLNCLLKWNQRQSMEYNPTTCPICRVEIIPAIPRPQMATVNITSHRFIRTGHVPSSNPTTTTSASNVTTDAPPTESISNIVLNEQVTQELNHIVNMVVNSIQRRGTPLELFEHAVLDNDYEKVKIITDEHPSFVNSRFSHEMTPLIFASYQRHLAIVELLLEKNANTRLYDKFGVTALHASIAVGALAISKKLIARGACVEAIDKNGESPLFYAVRARDVPATSMLIRKKTDINAVNFMGNTVFHIIAHNGFPFQMLQLLARKKPTCLAQQNSIGDNVLHIAVENNNFEFIRKFRSLIDLKTRYACNYIGYSAEDYLEPENPRYNRIKNIFESWNVAEELEESITSTEPSS